MGTPCTRECDCDSDDDCHPGYICTDVGPNDCALSGGIRAFDDSCTRNGSVAALDFNARCRNPDVGSRPGCVWPFVYKSITYTEGQCAEMDHFDGGYFGWCDTLGGWQYDALSRRSQFSHFVTDGVSDVKLRCDKPSCVRNFTF
jgi:hypothetical protein